MTSRASHRQEPQGVASVWQPDMQLFDMIVMSNLTSEPCLIYIIKDLKAHYTAIFEKLFLNTLFLFLSISFPLCLFIVLVY